MTAVRLRVHYIGRGVRGTPGQVVELEDAAARRLIAAGRATRAGQDPTPTPEPTEPDSAVTSTKPRRRRGKASNEDVFLNPDAGPQVLDPSNGRTSIPPD
ncbi:hypothetical protein ACFO9E_13385 [Streptomyces maoxianensis]|uniref:Uncharacterized protein n=1 Tax=Streptomyces maoxianensis TaxID=1459942 RepID=A0ABV9G5I7_9ACTN